MSNNFEIPTWAGKPPPGTHLDVTKDGKLIQKLMIDSKKCYFFGRNPQMCDFTIDHASCSRVHSAFVYHKALTRAFLVDLSSTHGTYIGNVKLEPQRPTPIPMNETFHFGASTRMYTLRERPQSSNRPIMEELEKSSTGDEPHRDLLGLPETETELESLTEFNTAHNRRISTLGITDDDPAVIFRNVRKRKSKRVTINEDEEVINPEDIDPSVGRFRNLVHTTVVQTAGSAAGVKRAKLLIPGHDGDHHEHRDTGGTGRHQHITTQPYHRTGGLYDDLSFSSSAPSVALGRKLGLPLPNPAPEIDDQLMHPPAVPSTSTQEGHDVGATPVALIPLPPELTEEDTLAPKKKKYAKEAWPGKKSGVAFM
ncbi:unnamed protein product [Cyprideis torosa]|uniref:Uncharacterized protein n=1 Tax=Cyprideis torosa TaxID=163714 RepID=A0A7R8WD60_9CRUS|nr:unnamed protein product [Cyprideis torosa]CAG0894288.1 unnamed protein product [Cyprideis torosa]